MCDSVWVSLLIQAPINSVPLALHSALLHAFASVSGRIISSSPGQSELSAEQYGAYANTYATFQVFFVSVLFCFCRNLIVNFDMIMQARFVQYLRRLYENVELMKRLMSVRPLTCALVRVLLHPDEDVFNAVAALLRAASNSNSLTDIVGVIVKENPAEMEQVLNDCITAVLSVRTNVEVPL